MKHILKCAKCGKYTMKENCDCTGRAITVKPAKFSIDDAYGDYRRKVKFEMSKSTYKRWLE